MSKIVSQLDPHGFFVGAAVADPSPLEPGVFLIPGGAVDAEPPEVPKGQRARWNGGAFVVEAVVKPAEPAAPPEPTLDERKSAKRAEIDAARADGKTFAHGGKTFACDADARSDIDGVTGYVALFGVLPPDFPGAWKAVDDSDLPIADVAAWKTFYAALVAHGAATRVRLQQIKVRLEAATTSASLADIAW